MRSDDGAARDSGPGWLVLRTRRQRGISRKDVAIPVGISEYDLFRLESGLWVPGRDTLIRLAEQLDLPLRVRNELLSRAGYAAAYDTTPVDASRMARFRAMLDQVVRGHGDCPALAVDRMWNVVTVNEAAALITDSVPSALRVPQINLLRTNVHPDCLARWVVNGAEWTAYLLGRLLLKVEASQDSDILALYEELRSYHPALHLDTFEAGRFSPLRINREGEQLTLVNAETRFALPLDVTADEITVQAFFPADTVTARILRRRASERDTAD